MDRKQLLDLWTFQWPVVGVLVGGHSSIDLEDLRLTSHNEASEFLAAYGYNPNDPKCQRVLHATMIEALTFIERHLLTVEEWQYGFCPPELVLSCTDARQLLIWASGHHQDKLTAAWSCAVLRVMHTIAHIDGVNRVLDLNIARDQIFDRVRSKVFRDDLGLLHLGDQSMSVPVSLIEWKEAKSRDSIILKLLHKKNNVAEAIYDYVGVRIITKRVCDVPLVIKCLRHFNILVYPNAYPARARNNLIDINDFKTQIEGMTQKLADGLLTAEEFAAALGEMKIKVPFEDPLTANPHSAESYHSVQMTGRQLIRFKNDGFEWLEKIKSFLDRDLKGQGRRRPRIHDERRQLVELRQMIDSWYSVGSKMNTELFFPFEIQILDEKSHVQAASGAANHDRYKSSQLQSARKRVLYRVIELTQQTGRSSEVIS